MNRLVVVGVDGSAGSLAALRFALEEARLRKATLRVVSAWELPLREAAPDPFLLELPSFPGPEIESLAKVLEENARHVIDDALGKVLDGEAAGVEVERLAVEGGPASSLIEASRDADLLALGSRGHGGLRGLLLGSVSQHCVHHASCPVTIVRAREQ